MRYFKQVLKDIDAAALLRQVHAHPVLWNQEQRWAAGKKDTVLYGLDSIVLRANKSPDWDKPARKTLSAVEPILHRLTEAVGGTVIGTVVISRLPSKAVIAPHKDTWPAAIARNLPPPYQRFQVPLQAAANMIFVCGDEMLEMQPGSVWWFDNQMDHTVVNNSAIERISMRVDVHIPAR